MSKAIDLESSWLEVLESEFEAPYMKQLKAFLADEINAHKTLLPKPLLWFNALNTTPLHDIKVVILGQDPYPTIGHAHGLCFSVLPEVKPLPKSLQNIKLQYSPSFFPCLNSYTNQDDFSIVMRKL